MVRLLVILAALIFAAALSVLLAGCATPEPFVSGVQVAAPAGWMDFCKRNPGDCK